MRIASQAYQTEDKKCCRKTLFMFSLNTYFHKVSFTLPVVLTGEHPGHGGRVHGAAKMSWWSREGKRGPPDFLRRDNGEPTLALLLLGNNLSQQRRVGKIASMLLPSGDDIPA